MAAQDQRLPDEEHAQIQEDECESISLIYPNEFSLISGSVNEDGTRRDANSREGFGGEGDLLGEGWKLVHPISYSIKLRPPGDQIVDDEKQLALWPSDPDFALRITYPPVYPDVPPAFRFQFGSNDSTSSNSSSQLHPVQEEACLAAIYTAIQSEVGAGVPCVMTCITAAREFFENGGLASGLIHSLSDDTLSSILVYLATSANIIEEIVDALPIFRTASRKGVVWKQLCRLRWKDKWGFQKRWQSATDDEKVLLKSTEADSPECNLFWYNRFHHEEEDAKREIIRADELTSMVFDLRMWFGRPNRQPGHMRDVIPTGLERSISSNVCFVEIPGGSQIFPANTNEAIVVSGRMRGLPETTTRGMYWYLKDSDRVSQIFWYRYSVDTLGVALPPHVFYTVRRLNSWGWELRDNYAAMRAIDVGNIDGRCMSEWVDEDNHEGRTVEALRGLWSDYLDNMMTQEKPEWMESKIAPYPCDYREIPDDEDLKSLLPW